MYFKRILLLCFLIFLGLAKSATISSSHTTIVPPQNAVANQPTTNNNTTTVAPQTTVANQPTSNNTTTVAPQTTAANKPATNNATTVAPQTTVKNIPQNGSTIDKTVVETTTNAYITTVASQTTTKNDSQETTTWSPAIVDVWETKKFNYVIIDDTTQVPCTMTKMNITLTIPYKTKQNKIDTKTLTVPFNANATGTCSEDISVLTLAWQETDMLDVTVSDGINELTMNIVKDGDIQYVQFLVVSIALDNLTFPDAAEPVIKGNSTNNLILFRTFNPNSVYICNDTHKIQTGDIIVIIDNIEFIAFNTNATNNSSRKQEFCPTASQQEPKGRSKSIGIIVGGVLIAMVGICLIIFIINRYSRRVTSWNIMKS